MRISVVIPVYNQSEHLERCLAGLRDGASRPDEIVVVDDGSEEDVAAVALRHGARVLRQTARQGPAAARNAGARAASGDVLLFVDADTFARPDMVARMREWFAQDAALAALIGAYDDDSADRGFLSQWKNLTHRYYHVHGRQEARTFWSGCGAVRREVFFRAGGFDERYRRPSIEDIAFGYQLRRRGAVIRLDPQVQVKHGKRWTLWALIKTDMLCRAAPWTELMLCTRWMPDDLNLQRRERWSLALCLVAVASLAGAAVWGGGARWALTATSTVTWGAMILNQRNYLRYLAGLRGPLFAAKGFGMQILYYLYSAAGLALGVGAFLWHRAWEDDSVC